MSDQIKFIETLKYYQQSLSYAGLYNDRGKKTKDKKRVLKLHWKWLKLSKNVYSCSVEDPEWILNYFPSGKGTIPYEMITRFDPLDIAPEDGAFIVPHLF